MRGSTMQPSFSVWCMDGVNLAFENCNIYETDACMLGFEIEIRICECGELHRLLTLDPEVFAEALFTQCMTWIHVNIDMNWRPC